MRPAVPAPITATSTSAGSSGAVHTVGAGSQKSTVGSPPASVMAWRTAFLMAMEVSVAPDRASTSTLWASRILAGSCSQG